MADTRDAREPRGQQTHDATMASHIRCLGILAGSGSLPAEIARSVVDRGGRVAVVAIGPGSDPRLNQFPCVHVGIGQVGAMVSTFRNAECDALAIVGGVTRPDLARLRPDWGLITNVFEIAGLVLSGGDDGVLRRVVRFFEAKGFRVVSPAEVAPDLLVGAGNLTQTEPDTDDTADILVGSSVITALAPYDVGQAVIVSKGRLLGVEAAEGTDRMIARIADRRDVVERPKRPGGVLVKKPKPGQELRIDLPAIGPATVALAAKAGLSGIAVLAGHALAARRRELLADAAAAQLFVYGFTDKQSSELRSPDELTCSLVAVGAKSHTRRDASDLAFGAGALGKLAAFGSKQACLVSRGHILGVETDGDIVGLLERARGLHQWGFARFQRHVGVLVLGEGCVVDPPMIEAARRAQMGGIAVMGARLIDDELVARAAARGLFVVRVLQSS